MVVVKIIASGGGEAKIAGSGGVEGTGVEVDESSLW